MAISVTTRGLANTTSGTSGTNTIAVSNFSPAAGSLLVSAFSGQWQQGAVGTHTVTDGFTSDATAQARQAFCRRATVIAGQYAEHVGLWTAVMGGTPGTNTCTGTRDTGTVDQVILIGVLEIAGAAASSFVGGTTGTTDRQAAGPSTLTLDLGAAPASDSLIVTMCMTDSGTTVPTLPTGFTSAGTYTDNSNGNGTVNFAYLIGGGTQTLQWTALNTAKANLAAAIEIKAAGAAFIAPAPLLINQTVNTSRYW